MFKATLLLLCAVLLAACSQNQYTNPDFSPWEVNSEKPVIIHAGWVDRGILGITIKEGNLVRSEFMPYEKQPGDSVAIEYDNNGIVKKRLLFRKGEAIGYLAGAERNFLSTFEKITGDSLDQQLLAHKSSYTLFAGNSSESFSPLEVYRKSKIHTKSNATNQIAMLHTVYLKLPEELLNAVSIKINFGEIKVEDPEFTFHNTPTLTRSESVHVTHGGFRPDDPVKRAYLSIWLGTGGPHAFEQEPLFQVLEHNSRQIVYKGIAVKALAHDGVEKLKDEKNYSKTEVWHLNFDDLQTPGEYVIYMEGVGTSYPFGISENVWENNFAITMLGFLTHRSGLAIDESMGVNFVRPRSFHPEDGVIVYDSDFSLFDNWVEYGGSQDGSFKGLVKNKTDKIRTDAWGGYMDAGDWDRRIHHLNSSRQLLELYFMYPDYFSGLKLTVPENEINNGIPDILDEVAWNVDCYGRMQGPEGGISLGIESAAHPAEGEPSWLESLDIFRFSEDPHSSFVYASMAAPLSRAIEKYDSEKALWYKESALKAFAFGIQYKNHPRFEELSKGNLQSIHEHAALAAIEMYKLTREHEYYDIFKEHTTILTNRAQDEIFGARELDAAFALAIDDTDDVIASKDIDIARNVIADHANLMLDMLRGNSYNLVFRNPDAAMLNGYYSAANNQEICRAYFLTGEQKYLDGAILSVMYTSGANPMNMTLTSGLGHRYPQRPLHLDSEFTGQPAPYGITVYAQADHEYYQSILPENELRGSWGTWATYWFSGRLNTPSGWDWPPHEAYIDYSRFPSMNEYTVHQTFGPISYAYGFLAARGK